MPFKILSQSGISLADAYEIQGSIAGVERLDPEDVKTVHEMGGVMFSERFSGTIRRRSTGAVAQSTAINEVVDDFPGTPVRILGVSVLIEDGLQARVSRLAVMVRDPLAGRELPIWVWDGSSGNGIEIVDNGAAVASFSLARPLAEFDQIPSFLVGAGQPQSVPDIAMRGTTGAFGAGTVEVILLVYIAFAEVAGISSLGLPIPGW